MQYRSDIVGKKALEIWWDSAFKGFLKAASSQTNEFPNAAANSTYSNNPRKLSLQAVFGNSFR
jgi:hypothetical protein